MPQSIDDITLNSYVNQLRGNVPLPKPDPRFQGPTYPSEPSAAGTFVDYLPRDPSRQPTYTDGGFNPPPSAFLAHRGYDPRSDMGIMQPAPSMNVKPLDAVYGAGNHRIMTRSPSSDMIDDGIREWLQKHPFNP